MGSFQVVRVVLLSLAVLALAAPAAAARPRILAVTKTAGFHHDSIPAAVSALQSQSRFAVDVTTDGSALNGRNLARYKAVVFLLTTGDVLDAAQQRAFELYVRHGGGYVGIHSAADTEYDWPFYGRLMGAYFKGHPAVQPATVHVVPAFAATARLPRAWTRTDEWYDFRTNPGGHVRVLATVDESTYTGGTMGADHPLVWCHHLEKGRGWYSEMGHTAESWSDPAFRRHVMFGLRFAAQGLRDGCPAR
jgi:type 1 glutamine amidotransferase